MVGLVFLISISVLSCQINDADDYSQQAEDMTAADLFIASEAHQNLEKEIRKNMRKMLNAISKFSKEEMEQYQQLKKNYLLWKLVLKRKFNGINCLDTIITPVYISFPI